MVLDVPHAGGWQEPGELADDLDGDAVLQRREDLLDGPFDLVVTDRGQPSVLARRPQLGSVPTHDRARGQRAIDRAPRASSCYTVSCGAAVPSLDSTRAQARWF